MNIVILGAHPDDPESGCGGLGILAVQQGHCVIFAYLSSGVPGRKIGNRLEDEVREEEARDACRVCGVKPYFFKCPCSDIQFNLSVLEKVSDFMRDVNADLVLTHWPIDTHPDHQIVGALGTQVVVGNPDIALAYYEVITGIQTIAFEPNRFIDITQVARQKKKAVDCHVSQNVKSWWRYHDEMELVRYTQVKGFNDSEVGRAEGYYLAVSTHEAEKFFVVRTGFRPSGSRTKRKVKHEKIALYQV